MQTSSNALEASAIMPQYVCLHYNYVTISYKISTHTRINENTS